MQTDSRVVVIMFDSKGMFYWQWLIECANVLNGVLLGGRQLATKCENQYLMNE